MSRMVPWGKTLDELLAAGPQPGGTHRWIARIAAGAIRFLPPEKVRAFLRMVCDLYVNHRKITNREIDAAITFALTDRPRIGSERLPDWPEQDPEWIQRLAGHPAPFRLPAAGEDVDTGYRGLDAIRTLFRNDELICAGRDPFEAQIYHGGWLGHNTPLFQFIVANPMRGPYALTQTGKYAARCQTNVRLIRHLVVEFDGHTKTLQASLIGYLSTFLPLRLVVDAAGKSLHAWFVASNDPVYNFQFYFLAVRLGADQTRFDYAGWVRMPGGMRPKPDGLHLQRILYLGDQ